ncbi:hypothetical protein Goari_022900 [Gossypium aridum]|uniref:PGG domain-containing protein n=1 Tax=Gossypium aridum TaxID=34290 RepID=A0A7J8YSV3_GOSAI|nr:hypothetical protein [Gossypium aridum]
MRAYQRCKLSLVRAAKCETVEELNRMTVINKGTRQDVFDGKLPTKAVKEEKTPFAKVENEVLEQGQLEIRTIKMASSSSQATIVVNLSSNGNPAGDWESATRVFEQNPKATMAMIMGSMYALHVTVGARKANEFVEKLVERMSLEEVAMVNGSGATTLSIAAAIGNTDAVKLLVCKNPDLPNILGMDGGFPIHRAAQFGHRETLLYLLQVTKAEYPELAKKKDFGLESPLCSIAVMHSAFFSSSELTLRDRLIDSCVPSTLSLENVANNSNRGDVENTANKSQASILPRVKQIHEMKLMHGEALKLVELLCMHAADLDPSGAVNIFKHPVFMAGTHEILRHHKVFSLISRISHEQKLIVADNMDNFSNNMLHLVGNLAPPDQLNRVYGVALQMQRELQWEVENVVPNFYQDARNIERKTPRIVFTEEYEELVKEGERWMKDAANSCSVVAALIATVVFAAAITVLGGTNGDSEFLVFKSEKAFVIFAMSDAPSLFSSTAAILMFLSMLTARYVEDDFLQALPKRLIMGLLTLFISITTMMIAFSSTLYLVFGEAKTWILVCVAESTRVLVTLFIYLQFRLLVDMFYSTYGHGIFGKRSEKPLY